MRKMSLTLACLFLLCLCASCAAKTGDAALLSSPPVTTGGEPSDDMPSAEPSPSPTPSSVKIEPSPSPSPVPPSPTENEPTPSMALPVFDPLNPDGWELYGNYDENGEWINKDKWITPEDFFVGDFHIGMSLEDSLLHFPSNNYVESESDDDYYVLKHLIFDSLILTYIRETDDTSNQFDIFSIETTSNEYVTARGLRVGDSAEKLYALYGIPVRVSNDVWYYYDEYLWYNRFRVTVTKGIVEKMYLTQIL